MPPGIPYLDHVPLEVELFHEQADLLEATGLEPHLPPVAELAVFHEPRSGASRALMVLGVCIAAHQPGARVLVLGRDLETMRVNWAAREGGIWEFCHPYVVAGVARTAPWYVGFPAQDSRLVFRSFKDARQVPDATHVLIDDAESMSVETYRGLRDRVLSRPPLSGETAGAVRLITVARAGAGGWAGAELRAIEGERVIFEMTGRGMPASLREAPRQLEAGPRITLRDYIQRAEPNFRLHYHTEMLIWTAQLALDREVDQLWISMPPGYGKSWVISSAFPSCELYVRRQNNALVVASTDQLAAKHSTTARKWFRAAGGLISADQDSRYSWATVEGGGYEARGKGSALLSLRGDVIVFDDPFGSRIEAGRRAAQLTAWQTWEELETRVQRFGHLPAVRVLMHQRLDRLDVLGRALDEEREKASGERIAFLNLAAIKRRLLLDVPSSVVQLHDLDTREEGEPLCEEIHSLAKLKNLEERNPRRFRIIYGGDPPADGGGAVFSRGHLVELDEVPPMKAFSMLVRSWDLAASENKTADYTASVLLGRLLQPIEVPNGKPVHWVILDATNKRVGPRELFRHIGEVAEKDGFYVSVVVPQDPGAGGKVVFQLLVTQLSAAGISVQQGVVGSSEGGKLQRATPASGAMDPGEGSGLETGSVAIVRHRRGSHLEELVDQLDAFTGKDADRKDQGLDPLAEQSAELHDDLVDAFTQAFNFIAAATGWGT